MQIDKSKTRGINNADAKKKKKEEEDFRLKNPLACKLDHKTRGKTSELVNAGATLNSGGSTRSQVGYAAAL